MDAGKYKDFSLRLIKAMKDKGHIASRSPNGICMSTLSRFAGASEQICRRYIRGDALPDYDKVINIAEHLQISPGWLLFGERDQIARARQQNLIDQQLLYYILKKSHHLYREETGNTDDYADFVMELVRDVREIDTSSENIRKIIDLAISSISSYEEKRIKKSHVA